MGDNCPELDGRQLILFVPSKSVPRARCDGDNHDDPRIDLAASRCSQPPKRAPRSAENGASVRKRAMDT